MNPSIDVTIDENEQIVVQRVCGNLDGAAFDELEIAMEKAVEKLKNTAIVRILVDAANMKRGTAAARRRGRELFVLHQNVCMAVFGANPFVRVIMKFFLIVQGAKERIGIFTTENEAREWLKSRG